MFVRIDEAGDWATKPGHVVWIGLHEPSEELLRLRRNLPDHGPWSIFNGQLLAAGIIGERVESGVLLGLEVVIGRHGGLPLSREMGRARGGAFAPSRGINPQSKAPFRDRRIQAGLAAERPTRRSPSPQPRRSGLIPHDLRARSVRIAGSALPCETAHVG